MVGSDGSRRPGGVRWYRGIAKTNVAIICEIELSIAVTGAISQHTV